MRQVSRLRDASLQELRAREATHVSMMQLRPTRRIVEFEPNIHESPWNATEWDGRITSVDDEAETTPIALADVERVLALGASLDWVTCIVKLRDGRYAGWSSFLDSTGSGFHGDAYGGDCEVFVTLDAERLSDVLPEQDVEHLELAATEAEADAEDVIRDAWLAGQATENLLALAARDLPRPLRLRLRVLTLRWQRELAP